MCNNKIRAAALGRGVKFWQVAAELCIAASSFSRKMRFEMPEEEQNRIVEIINQIADERERSYRNA